MQTYQTLSLIGCILGMLLTIGLFIIMGALIGTSDVLLNMTKGLNKTQDLINQQRQDASKAALSPFIAGTAFAFLLYIAGIVITFVIKNTKAVGISLLIIGVIAMAITNLWGIIAFALLLPAGILALRFKKPTVASTLSE